MSMSTEDRDYLNSIAERLEKKIDEIDKKLDDLTKTEPGSQPLPSQPSNKPSSGTTGCNCRTNNCCKAPSDDEKRPAGRPCGCANKKINKSPDPIPCSGKCACIEDYKCRNQQGVELTKEEWVEKCLKVICSGNSELNGANLGEKTKKAWTLISNILDGQEDITLPENTDSKDICDLAITLYETADEHRFKNVCLAQWNKICELARELCGVNGVNLSIYEWKKIFEVALELCGPNDEDNELMVTVKVTLRFCAMLCGQNAVIELTEEEWEEICDIAQKLCKDNGTILLLKKHWENISEVALKLCGKTEKLYNSNGVKLEKGQWVTVCQVAGRIGQSNNSAEEGPSVIQ